jgi:uncharacterized protein (DUF1800 family)
MRTVLILAWVVAALPALDEAEARHLLARTGFAPTAAGIAALLPLGRADAVEAVLATARASPVLEAPAWCRTPLPEAWQARRAERQAADALAPEAKQKRQDELRARDQAQGRELKAWWYGEMLATDSPLTERMVLFWHNHFTSQLEVVEDPRLMWEQNQLLRRHALGSFARLALAIPFDAAMFRYLDSDSNVAAHPNENFAREVMELFTVGEGNYAEDDIKEAARAFSGYRLDDTVTPQLDPRRHDYGRKDVLGHQGVFDATGVLEILLTREKNVALTIAAKLWREFVSDSGDDKAIYEVAAAFYRSRYQVTAALRALLLRDEFWAEANRGGLVKAPVELLVGFCRQQGVAVRDRGALVDFGKRLGQDLFDPPNVKGWAGGRAWITTHGLLARRQVLDELLAGRLEHGQDAAPPRSSVAAQRPEGMKPAGAGPGMAAAVAAAVAAIGAPGTADAAPLHVLARPPLGGGGTLADLVRDPVYNLK